MSYQFIDEGPTILKVIDNGRELLFKKVYCSTAIDGDYFILNTHNFENNIYRQEFKIYYTECDNPALGSAYDLKNAVDVILNNYAYGYNPKSYLIAYDRNNFIPIDRNVGYALTYSDIVLNQFIGIDGSRINFDKTGIYNLQFSIQFTNNDTQFHDVDIWFALNGNRIDNSNSKFSIVGTHGGITGHHIASWNFMFNCNVGDYIEIYYQVSDTNVNIETISSVYDEPDSPSIILSINEIG